MKDDFLLVNNIQKININISCLLNLYLMEAYQMRTLFNYCKNDRSYLNSEVEKKKLHDSEQLINFLF